MQFKHTIQFSLVRQRGSLRSRFSAGCALLVLGLGGCDNLLDVEFPGTVPAAQLNDPSLAAVLVRSAISDLECAYSGYTASSAAHSDEYQTANQTGGLIFWGQRQITAEDAGYVFGSCEGPFGVQLILHTARVQAEQTFAKLSNWTDAQVPNRTSLMAQTRAYNGFAYVFMGETFCRVAFDGGADQPPAAALTLAEQRFTEALTLAQQANNTDVLNMARVGRARARAGLRNWAGAAADAQLVPPNYAKLAERGSESPRRFNDVFSIMNQQGAYTIAFELRTIADPRLLVVNSGRPVLLPTVPPQPLWITNKYTSLSSGIPLATYREAQLILAEALAEQDQAAPAMAILNTRRVALSLAPLTATTKAEALVHVINERRMELAFEGGHRLYDLLRKTDLVWKGRPRSSGGPAGPIANSITGQGYGPTTCWPHPTAEIAGS